MDDDDDVDDGVVLAVDVDDGVVLAVLVIPLLIITGIVWFAVHMLPYVLMSVAMMTIVGGTVAAITWALRKIWKKAQAREADAARQAQVIAQQYFANPDDTVARNMMGASTGTDAQDDNPAPSTDKYDTPSPILQLQKLAEQGNMTARNIIDRYSDLEYAVIEAGDSVDVLRAEYNPKFNAMANLLTMQQNIHVKPNDYRFGSKDSINDYVRKGEASLMDQISEHIRTLNDMQLSKAQANAEYLASTLDAVEES